MAAFRTCLLSAALAALPIAAALNQQTWFLNSLESIGGHKVTVSGTPKVVSTEHGEAMAFDGDGDRLLVEGNPFGDARVYTLEMVFKPKSTSAANDAPRFLHIEVPGQPKRVIFELRFNSQGAWAFDAGMTTDVDYQILFDQKLAHKGDEWAHVASSYDGTTMKSFVNYKQELSVKINSNSRIIEAGAVSSIAARMNKVYWMNGLIKAIRVTAAPLDPKDFLSLDAGPTALLPPRPALGRDPKGRQGLSQGRFFNLLGVEISALLPYPARQSVFPVTP